MAAAGEVTYTYDALGRRIIRDPDGSGSAPATWLFHSDQWQVIEEDVQGTSTNDARYVWSPLYVDALTLRDRDADGADNTTPASIIAGKEERVWALQDANWNVTALVGDTNPGSGTTWEVVERFRYDPYGTSTVLAEDWSATTDAFDWQYLHQGGRRDDTTGDYHFRNRDLDTDLGRWNRPDPLGYVDGMGAYEYERSGPERLWDPAGLRGGLLREALQGPTIIHNMTPTPRLIWSDQYGYETLDAWASTPKLMNWDMWYDAATGTWYKCASDLFIAPDAEYFIGDPDLQGEPLAPAVSPTVPPAWPSPWRP